MTPYMSDDRENKVIKAKKKELVFKCVCAYVMSVGISSAHANDAKSALLCVWYKVD